MPSVRQNLKRRVMDVVKDNIEMVGTTVEEQGEEVKRRRSTTPKGKRRKKTGNILTRNMQG